MEILSLFHINIWRINVMQFPVLSWSCLYLNFFRQSNIRLHSVGVRIHENYTSCIAASGINNILRENDRTTGIHVDSI